MCICLPHMFAMCTYLPVAAMADEQGHPQAMIVVHGCKPDVAFRVVVDAVGRNEPASRFHHQRSSKHSLVWFERLERELGSGVAQRIRTHVG